MAQELKFFKVNTLPSTLTKDSVYMVKNGVSHYDIYITDRNGSIARTLDSVTQQNLTDAVSTAVSDMQSFVGDAIDDIVFPVTKVNGKVGDVIINKDDVGLGRVENYEVADEIQATEGTSNTKYMTPLRTKQAIDNAIFNTPVQQIFKVVSELPPVGLVNFIYIVAKVGSDNDNHDEFMWVDGAWELVGTLDIDLDNYDTRDEVDTKISTYDSILKQFLVEHHYTIDEITTILDGYYTITQMPDHYYDIAQINDLIEANRMKWEIIEW